MASFLPHNIYYVVKNGILGKRLNMTDKELRRLRRQDLLELLLEQSKEAARFQMESDKKQQELSRILESYERLKGKLDDKDAVIEKLKGRLDEKDSLIEKLKKRLDNKDEKIEKLEKENLRIQRTVHERRK